ncbi:MAG: sigma-70 family RNA polymerase sigma factor [Bacteroidota bacterium]
MPFTGNTNQSSLTDKELVDLYKNSTGLDALGELYRRYMDLVYGVCLKYMNEPEDAKDCVINIFEELITKVKKYEIENFKAWLYQLAKNHCLMKIRANKNKPRQVNHEFVHLEENVHLNGVFEKEAHFEKMEYCLGQLVTEQRQVIELFYLKEKCYKSIVEITGLDANKVRSFIQNGRRNLKICMEKQAMENS